MGTGHNELKFRQAVLNASESQLWDEAKAEWKLHMVYNDHENERSCKCEHSPIYQICLIRNRRNGNKLEVGNVCVRRFLRLMSHRIFAVLRRVHAERDKSLNPDSLDLFVERGVLSPQERDDYKVYWRRRKHMTDQQRAQKKRINDRVLRFVQEETATLQAMARKYNLRVQQRLPAFDLQP